MLCIFPDTETCLPQVLESTCCLVSRVCIMGRKDKKDVTFDLCLPQNLSSHAHTEYFKLSPSHHRQERWTDAWWWMITNAVKRVMYKCVVIDLFLWNMFWILVWMKKRQCFFSLLTWLIYSPFSLFFTQHFLSETFCLLIHHSSNLHLSSHLSDTFILRMIKIRPNQKLHSDTNPIISVVCSVQK